MNALDYLACPLDKQQLEVRIEKKENNRIKDGYLSCKTCGTEYKIKDGLINFLNSNYENDKPVNEEQIMKGIKEAVLSSNERSCLRKVNSLGSYFLDKTQNKKESINLLMKKINYILNNTKISPNEIALLMQSATAARYNLENYSGTFMVSDEVLEKILPYLTDNDGVFVEGAPGPGDYLLNLREKLESDMYIGVDISSRMVRLGQKKMKNSAEDDTLFVQGNVCELPLKDAVTSLYVLNNAWDRVSKPRNAAEEAGRILKSNNSGTIFSNCIPLQYEVVRDGVKVVYVPKSQRLNLKDAVKIARCEPIVNRYKKDVWLVRSLYDGLEKFPMQTIAGVRR